MKPMAPHSSLTSPLDNAAWFSTLNATQQSLVRATAIERGVGAGEYVARAGATAAHWIGVFQGFLRMSVVAADGNETTLHFLREGEWGGEGSMLKHERRRYDVVAVQASRICLLPASTFDLLLTQSMPFNNFLLVNLNERMGTVTALLEATRILAPDRRVARCLALLVQGRGLQALVIPQHQLASLCGLSRQRTNVALHALRSEGLLDLDGFGIQVVDLAGLARYGTAPGAAF